MSSRNEIIADVTSCKCKIGIKLLVAFLGLSLLTLVCTGFIALNALNDLGNYSEESSIELGDSATNDSTVALQELGEEMIEQKATDIAGQMAIYIKAHENMTVADLQANSDFINIAVQPVGETGYTVALDVNDGMYYFHKFQEVFGNKSAETLFDDPDSDYYNPNVWDLINQTISTKADSAGYYEWIEPETGEIRHKYVSFAVVNATTADGKQMFVAATTYIDEFSRPSEEIKEKIDETTEDSTEHTEKEIRETRIIFIGLMTGILVLVVILSLLLARKITDPIKELSRGAGIIGKGDLDFHVDIDTGDELEELASSFNTMASDLKTQMAQLEKTTRAKEKIERELQIAHDIQKGFLPIKAPEIEGYKMAGVNLPAREVGGDFYDFIELGDGKIGIVIADVSGKGVPAALFMAISKTLLRTNAKRILDPVEALKEVNSIILDESDSGMFVTLFYAILDQTEHTLTFINAGHNPPILMKKDNLEIALLKAKGIPIGVLDDLDLESKTIGLEENELVFLYTDGVTEAINEKDEEFGTDRLEAIIRREPYCKAENLIESVIREIKEFAGKMEQFDDITMVVLQSRNECDE